MNATDSKQVIWGRCRKSESLLLHRLPTSEDFHLVNLLSSHHLNNKSSNLNIVNNTSNITPASRTHHQNCTCKQFNLGPTPFATRSSELFIPQGKSDAPTAVLQPIHHLAGDGAVPAQCEIINGTRKLSIRRDSKRYNFQGEHLVHQAIHLAVWHP